MLTLAAGTGVPGFSGDGGPASAATLRGASAVATDSEGNLYIADTNNSRIRMVGREGVITTVAGTGEPGFSGDGGPATKARLLQPAALVVDSGGNLYIADLGTYRIRMVDREGVISTVVGTGSDGFSPDGTPAANVQLGGVSGHVPSGLQIDEAGTLYFIDYGNNRIRLIDSDGLVRTVAGNGEVSSSGDGGEAAAAGLYPPLDIALGNDGNIFIATHDHGDGFGQRVRMVDKDGLITTLAGTGVSGYSGDGGRADEATFNIPAAVALGPDGNLYIADADNDVIRMVEL